MSETSSKLFILRDEAETAGDAKPFEVLLIPHSHLDIGYTEFPAILADAHGDYIAQALDLMTETDHRPDEERYRWVCESFWAVEQFLRRHPDRREEMKRRMREGRMEVTAAYVNMTDLATPQLVERSLQPAVEFCREAGVELVTACSYDVNGFGWDLPRVLKKYGVKYLDTAINEVCSLPVRPRPQPYRVASPDGSEVLMWHSLGYMAGNDHRLNVSRELAEEPLAALLNRLLAECYPLNTMGMLISGVTGDSMPPDRAVCDVVRDWNAKWRSPHLRIATDREWFEILANEWPQPVTRQAGAWCDWWAYGIGAAAREAALVRRAQARLFSLEIQKGVLEAQGVDLSRLNEEYETAWRCAMLYCEHTFGAYETGFAPYSNASIGQWYHIAADAYAADAWCDSIALEQAVAAATGGRVSARRSGLTNATLQGEPAGYYASGAPPALLVFNPSISPVTQTISVHVPGHFVPGATPGIVDPRSGEPVPTLVTRYVEDDVVNRAHWKVEFTAADLPPGEHLVLLIEPGEPTPDPEFLETFELSNERYALRIDPVTGAIASLVDRASGRELAQPVTEAQPYGLNDCVYDIVEDPRGRLAVSSWFGLGNREVPFRRTIMRLLDKPRARRLPFGEEITWRTGSPQGVAVEVTVRLTGDTVTLTNRLTKPETDAAESLFFAFPLLSPRGAITLQTAGGAMRPGIDQVEGTATDWHAVQDWFAVSDADTTLVVATPDVPLAQCTGINSGLWRERLPEHNGVVMSWPMNNYWFTNFPTRQGGEYTFTYALRAFDGPFDEATATAFAGQIRRPAWAHAVRLTSADCLGGGGV